MNSKTSACRTLQCPTNDNNDIIVIVIILYNNCNKKNENDNGWFAYVARQLLRMCVEDHAGQRQCNVTGLSCSGTVPEEGCTVSQCRQQHADKQMTCR